MKIADDFLITPRLITGEITEADPFGQAIAHFSTGTNLGLEVGGGLGNGSTQCIKSARLYSVENHPMNLGSHKAAMAARHGGVAIHSNSIEPEFWLTKEQVCKFYLEKPTKLNQYPLERVMLWYDEALAQAALYSCDLDASWRWLSYDFVLLDGCGYSAQAELAMVKPRMPVGSFIALDDCNDVKNWGNYHDLQAKIGIRLVWANFNYRNGAAIFQLT